MFKNTRTGYGWVAITLHWLMAVMVVGLFGLGLYMVELTYYDSWYRGSMDLHKSIGITLVILLIFRFFWRVLGTNPEPIAGGSTRLNKVAKTAHVLLYILLCIIVVAGYMISTADGRSIEVFSLFSIPAIDFSIAEQADIAGEFHYYTACTLIGLVLLHAFGAFKHHFIDKDKTLVRMIKPIKED
ncbi:MAG: cytochrome b [Pseudoalteromonas sp.]